MFRDKLLLSPSYSCHLQDKTQIGCLSALSTPYRKRSPKFLGPPERPHPLLCALVNMLML